MRKETLFANFLRLSHCELEDYSEQSLEDNWT